MIGEEVELVEYDPDWPQLYEAVEYRNLKRKLAAQHHGDRVAYTRAKTEFVASVLRLIRIPPS